MTKLPMKPIAFAPDNVIRFVPNRLVRYLLDRATTVGTDNMNTLAMLDGITDEERSQFAQLIGYSVSGWGDLSYADQKEVAKADAIAARLIMERGRKTPIASNDGPTV